MCKVHFDIVCFWKKEWKREWEQERQTNRKTEIVSKKENERKIDKNYSYPLSYVRCLMLAIVNTYLVLKPFWLLWNVPIYVLFSHWLFRFEIGKTHSCVRYLNTFKWRSCIDKSWKQCPICYKKACW